MKKKFWTILAATAFALLLATTGCSKTTVEKPVWETQRVEALGLSFEIPASWNEATELSTDTTVVFVPEDADLAKGTSNVTVTATDSSSKALKIKKVRDEYPAQFEEAMDEYFPGAAHFTYEDFKASIGDVFVASFQNEVSGVSMTQTHYIPLVNKKAISVVATDIGESWNPSLQEVSEHICRTMKVVK